MCLREKFLEKTVEVLLNLPHAQTGLAGGGWRRNSFLLLQSQGEKFWNKVLEN